MDASETALTNIVDEREEAAKVMLQLEESPSYEVQIIENMLVPSRPNPSIDEPPKLELKQLPEHLRYVFFGGSSTLPVIISVKLTHA